MNHRHWIILKKYDYGESDLVIHAIDESGQKVHALAKGARRSRKRFGGGVLEPSHWVEVDAKEPKNFEEGLWLLQEATLINGFSKLRTDYEQLRVCFIFLNLIHHVAQIGDVHSTDLFRLLRRALEELEQSKNPRALMSQFIAKLLYIQGLLVSDDATRLLVTKPFAEHNEVVKQLPLVQIENYLLQEVRTHFDLRIENNLLKN